MFDRNAGIGGSDAPAIMRGEWFPLWQQKTNRVPPPDLSENFQVQLGRHTEGFHVHWVAKTLGFDLTLESTVTVPQAGKPWRYATTDAWFTYPDTFLEVKHSHGRTTLREQAEKYMAQLQHCLSVLNRSACYFSVIAGNADPAFTEIAADPAYQAKLLEMEELFWWHVTNDVAPEEAPITRAEVKKLTDPIPVEGRRRYDMASNNHWADLAHTIVSYEHSAGIFESAVKHLKTLVPPDASEAAGHGVTIKRDKANRLRIVVKEDTHERSVA